MKDIMLLALDKGADPNAALACAAYWGYTDIVAHLLTLPGINVNAKNNNGKTPLQIAEKEGHTECAELLRAAGGE